MEGPRLFVAVCHRWSHYKIVQKEFFALSFDDLWFPTISVPVAVWGNVLIKRAILYHFMSIIRI